MKKLSIFFWWLLILGCAGFSPGIKFSMQALSLVNSFYETAINLKTQPNKLEAATLILQQADEIARKINSDKVSRADVINAELLKAQTELLQK